MHETLFQSLEWVARTAPIVQENFGKFAIQDLEEHNIKISPENCCSIFEYCKKSRCGIPSQTC